MEHEKFAELRDKILQPLAVRLIAKWPGLALRDAWASRIEDNYDECRRNIRSAMLSQFLPDPSLRIDRHKVAASVAWAILRAIPFTFAGNAIGGRLATEHLAFYAAIAVVASFGRSEAEKAGNTSLAVLYAAPFRFPLSTDGPYTEHTLKMLYQARPDGLNPFMMSNLLFVIEQYHLEVTRKATATS